MGIEIALGLTGLSAFIWLFLLLFWGQFWRSDQLLDEALPDKALPDETAGDRTGDRQGSSLARWPSVCAVVPARNEAELLPITLNSLLQQDYPGSFTVILVDDQSTDGTAAVARTVAQKLSKSDRLQVICSEDLPAGWTGKLWAMDQGTRWACQVSPAPDYILLTDADIEHGPQTLPNLVLKAEQEQLDLTSLMVFLRCKSFWEKLLIPAFVFFFEKLYPFPWVNDPRRSTAAAAGGCILMRRDALTRIGGISRIRQALIDDCSLAHAVKSSGNPETAPPTGRIWLGLTHSVYSLRPYPDLSTIWNMVARTAFTQLGYSPFLLVGTIIGMSLVYLTAPVGLVGGLVVGVYIGNWTLAFLSLMIWLLMAFAYWPTVRFYRCSPLFAFCLPLIAFLYTLMTVDSALRHWQGRGGSWKGRVYSAQ
ncbi:MAG: glycosyltransferase [Leptolyngbyaceae cyanobacterium bins.59]|nr:glycosyltransferase [Leptolyngbyaceae cyanobacterium bins.59]